MGLLPNQGYSSGENFNSAYSTNYGATFGTAATQASIAAAQEANRIAVEQAEKTREFNAAEAEKQRQFNALEAQKGRDYQTQMANTNYQRSVADMKAAGINPILAAGMGLGSANIGGTQIASGYAAQASNPNTFMSNSIADQITSGNSASSGYGWTNSENGTATFLEGIGELVDGLIAGINSSKTVTGIMDFFGIGEKTRHNSTDRHREQARAGSGTNKTGTRAGAGTGFDGMGQTIIKAVRNALK